MWRKALVLGLVLMAIGMVVGGAVGHESFIVWKLTHSETMGASATGASAAIIAAAITKSSLTGLALFGATIGGIGAAIVVGY